ncbi:MAG: thermonuclease family protein [Desulfobacterales bacterium]|nr:thermonuclease family protein [Desulfobacterales bacterium]
MRTKRVFLVIFQLVLAGTAQAGEFKVVRVYDGDRFKAQGHDIEIKVRLIGIDAPEVSEKKGAPGQPYSEEAGKHLRGLIYGKVVDIKGYGLDRYDRILGVVYLNGKNINLEMVKAGLAEVYRGKMTKAFDLAPYLQAEQIARTTQRGIWSVGTIYISPKAWRKRRR